MPNKLTPHEIAENLEFIEEAHLIKGLGAEYDEMCESVKQAASIIRRVASGELKPVVHAHWIKETAYVHDGYDYSNVPTFTCSNCRNENEYIHPPYCDQCGALMDESRDGNSRNGKDDSRETD